MRNISFMLTTQQFRDRTKDVTRRLRWLDVKPGDRLMGCEKCQGRKAGEPLVRLGAIVVVSVRREPLTAMMTGDYGRDEVRREGFPDKLPCEFVNFFCEANNCKAEQVVTRIEFKYL